MTLPRSSLFRIAQFYSKTERCTRWQPAHTKSRKLIRATCFSPHEARHSAVQNTGRKFQLLLHNLRTRYDTSDRAYNQRTFNELKLLQATTPGFACRRNSPTASPTGSLPAIPRTRVHRGPWLPCSSSSGGSEDCAPGIPVRLSNC